MRIESKLSEILQFVQYDCQIHGRGRKKWWADQIGIAPMMLSHWLAGRRSPSAGHLNGIHFIAEEIKAESQKADLSEFLWRHYYDNLALDPVILRSVAERLLLSRGLNSRLLALLSWSFEEFSPRQYEIAELPLSALWQNRLGWLYESAGLDPGFEPRLFEQTRSLLEIGPTNSGNRLEEYLTRKQTSLGKRWDLYDCPLNELKEQFNWRRSSRRNTKE